MIGFVVLACALGVSAVAAAVMQWRKGRFAPAVAVAEPQEVRLTAEMIGAPLGSAATLVQFSSAFCAPCRATRVLLADIAARTDGIRTVDIDAEAHLDLVRELDIMRTPTVLVLDGRGAIRTRASGLPRREQVMAALAAASS